ncbi:MAG: type IV secretion system protein TrbL [Afipia broomeae]|jgi:type IV secretion system protein TrbL|uniref:P-type conjugative transfer protein TrbL n=8 Tax=Pseudomonadota TaxID=1224 RepID=K8P7H7_9BRAD|nr:MULTISPECIES: P-type conjugative transfer protein TrbL [Alphaproteobacteria]AKR57846.1 conjugal transfer protein TrbL [Devosia sp. H5989]MAH71797.1 P-type conjugative transfer protein TrbL [Afipia sp.]MBK5654255.1 P-type conjugative transfer protein TrbL [Rhizobium sp.]MCK9907559.1 P-type conjugative transfer protein TrbL [Microbacteriaceae bacterium K1510]NGX98279.1 P-type conjugative transfer protein TrbL [Candidatus Afipia apatlaquensis]OUX59094.1 MAG: P-type conjugative transfer protei
MGGTGVIDHFLEVFTRYIDGGFGLLGGEVGFIATTLIVIDVTLAALFWSWGADDDIMARLVKKTLFVGVFAYLISNWNNLARIVFESFAGLGLKASGTGFAVSDLMRPGKVAQTGLDAGRPLLDSISSLMGYWSFFENFIQIACMFFAWALVLLAFFILAIQLFVTLIEFKLTTLAGFVLIPFGLFGKSAFMAERVLGNVISSGIKVLVLAVIIGIGSTLFSEFTSGFNGATPSIDDAMAIVLAALSLLGLGIFGPGIANGLISGGPQLGAGAAIGTGLAAGGVVAAGAAAAGAVVTGGAALAGGAAAAARGGAALAGGASTAYSLGAAGQAGASGVASGLGSVASTGAKAAVSPLKRAAGRAADSLKQSYQAGGQAATEIATGASGAATTATAEAASPGAASSTSDGPPAWAKRMKRSQQMSHGVQAAAHAVRSGDSHGGGSSVNLSESD